MALNQYWANFLIKELRESGLEIEYDGYLKNVHPTQTLYVKVCVDTNYEEPTIKIVLLPPLSEKKVMSHSCGPALENEFDFEILEIYTEPPIVILK